MNGSVVLAFVHRRIRTIIHIELALLALIMLLAAMMARGVGFVG